MRPSCGSVAISRSSRRGRRSSPSRATARNTPNRSPASQQRPCARPRGSTRPAAMAPSTTVSASPSTVKAPPLSWRSRTLRWLLATSVDRASASTRYGARTTFRARVTWGHSPTSSRVTGMSRTIPPARCSSRLGASRWSLSLACVSRTCSMRRSTALSRGCSSRAKISPSPTPTRSMWWPPSRRWSASWFTTCS